jgi:Ca-activated chloride channel family protein
MNRRDAQHVLLGVVLCVAVPFVTHARQGQQVFKSAAELVVLHVNVFDGRSDAVADLPKSAFTVFEDDKPQEIAFFSAGDVPVTVGLIVDNSASMIPERDMIRSGTRAFADSSHPEDEMFALVFNEQVRSGLPATVRFTKNRVQLAAALEQFPSGGKTALHDAVIAGLDYLEGASYQKRVLVVLSDGGDNASSHTEKDMIDRAAASNALIYTVLDPNAVVPGESRPALLRKLARTSGGVAYFPKKGKDVITAFEEIAGNIRRGYSIGYVPAAGHENSRHHRVKVTVRVAGRNNLSVRVRNGYTDLENAGTR